MTDVAMQKGEAAPCDGVLVNYERYAHLLLCENICQE